MKLWRRPGQSSPEIGVCCENDVIGQDTAFLGVEPPALSVAIESVDNRTGMNARTGAPRGMGETTRQGQRIDMSAARIEQSADVVGRAANRGL
jgi:hypothetical protein